MSHCLHSRDDYATLIIAMVLFVEFPFGLKNGKYTSPYASVCLPVSVCASCCVGSFQLRHALCSCDSSFIVLLLRPSESIRTAEFVHLIRFCHVTGPSLLYRRNMMSDLNVRIFNRHLHSMCLTCSRLEYMKNNNIVLVSYVSVWILRAAQHIFCSLPITHRISKPFLPRIPVISLHSENEVSSFPRLFTAVQ